MFIQYYNEIISIQFKFIKISLQINFDSNKKKNQKQNQKRYTVDFSSGNIVLKAIDPDQEDVVLENSNPEEQNETVRDFDADGNLLPDDFTIEEIEENEQPSFMEELQDDYQNQEYVEQEEKQQLNDQQLFENLKQAYYNDGYQKQDDQEQEFYDEYDIYRMLEENMETSEERIRNQFKNKKVTQPKEIDYEQLLKEKNIVTEQLIEQYKQNYLKEEKSEEIEQEKPQQISLEKQIDSQQNLQYNNYIPDDQIIQITKRGVFKHQQQKQHEELEENNTYTQITLPQNRNKNETKEERKQRKDAIKQAKKERRQNKQNLKQEFKKIKQAVDKNIMNQNYNVQGKEII